MNYIKNALVCLIFLLVVCINNNGFAQENLLDQEVSINFKNLSIKESLVKLEKEAGISTAYNDRELTDSKITITFEKELLRKF